MAHLKNTFILENAEVGSYSKSSSPSVLMMHRKGIQQKSKEVKDLLTNLGSHLRHKYEGKVRKGSCLEQQQRPRF